MNRSFPDWCYNHLRPCVTFVRGLFGIHSDFRPIGKAIFSPNGQLFVVSMANESYSSPEQGRVVTFDVRNAKGDFIHHIQTEIPALSDWAIGWFDEHTVFVKSHAFAAEVFVVGTSSVVYRLPEPFDDELLKAIEPYVAESTAEVEPRTRGTRWMIWTGAIFLVFAVFCLIASVLGMGWTFDSVATASAPRPSDVADGIGNALIPLVCAAPLALFGLVLLFLGFVRRQPVTRRVI